MMRKIVLAVVLSALSTPAMAQQSVSPWIINSSGAKPNCPVGNVSASSCPLPVSISGGGGSGVLALTPTDDGLALTLGGAAQTAIASNTSRKGCTIQNPATATDQGIATADNLYVNFGGTAAAASTSFELTPGQSISCSPLGIGTITSNVSVVAATTGHKVVAWEYN